MIPLKDVPGERLGLNDRVAVLPHGVRGRIVNINGFNCDNPIVVVCWTTTSKDSLGPLPSVLRKNLYPECVIYLEKV